MQQENQATGPLTPEEKARLKALCLRMLPGMAVIRRALGDTRPMKLPSSWMESDDPAIIRAALELTGYRLH